ncbi:MAG: long-chain fatty acid--CoA ligase [Desulfatibacillaceae bacterium]|nr:long-chain fatty acid--CoA ligase [Desulfatibacillaceae bacterium]
MTQDSIYDKKPWLKFYDQGVSASLDYRDITLVQALDAAVQSFGDNPALNFRGFVLTYKELLGMVDRFAAALSGMGVKKGDAVAILLPNCIPTVVAYYGALKLGAVVVMNNPLYSDRELGHQLNDSAAKVLVTLDLLANRMIELRPLTSVRQIVYTSIGDYLPFHKSLLFGLVAKKKGLAADVRQEEGVFRFKELLDKAAQKPPEVAVDSADLAMLAYTGGTTGISKGVMLTHANLSRNVQQLEAWFPGFEKGREVMLGALPFFHVFGLTTAMNFAIWQGWNNILVPKPQPDELLAAIRKFRPTFAPMVPAMFANLLNHPALEKTDMTCIKGCFSGSAPLPLAVIKEFEEITGATIVEGFGMTESSPVVTVNPFGGNRKPGSIGIPLPDTRCAILDLATGHKTMPPGERGELVVKGPQVMEGYWKNSEETAEALRDGWLFTGDIATMDEDGFFYIVDRKKDMIICGGFNVYPRDIDETFLLHPKVLEVCTVGIPHPTRGEAVKVFLVLKEGETATEQEMLDFCKERLAKYKWPVKIEFLPELPKSNVGKVLRKELRAGDQARFGV